MPTINLTGKFGLVLDAKPSDNSIFSKYLKSPIDISGLLNNAKAIYQSAKLSDDPLESLTMGMVFNEPVTLGGTGVVLTISPQLTGTLAVKKNGSLFDADSDPFADKIPVPAGQAYCSAVFQAKLALNLSATSGDLQFGFTEGTGIVLANHRLFPLSSQIVPALRGLLEDFALPAGLDDIDKMAQGTVATVEGSGSLKFTAQANLLTAVNPLATLGSIAGTAILQVDEGNSLTVCAGYTLTGGYQVRVQRLDGRKFQLGFEKQRGSDFDVSVAAQIDVTAGVGGFDLIKTLLQTVSKDPVPDKDAFKQAGLKDEQISSIAEAVKTGIERSLQLSLRGELDFLDSSSTAFSYAVDLDRLDAAGQQAVHDALRGDLTGLEASPLAGVTPLKSVYSSLRQGKQILKLNLLGIYNYGSVTTLFQKGTIIVDRETGETVITDQAGAKRIGFTSDNFAADGAKLRKILAESLLLTVAYRASGTVLATPQLAARHWFFELHQKTNLQNVQDYLNIAQALNVITPDAVSAKLTSLHGLSAFGRSTFYADASYTDPLVRGLFLDAEGQPRSQDEFENIGRLALATLLPAGDDPINDARRFPLTDSGIWHEMKKNGQSNDFAGLFNDRGFNRNQLDDIGTDYTVITWWAEAMAGMGVALAAILNYIAGNPQWHLEDGAFQALRAALDTRMASVVQNTRSEFSEPWGLLAMDLASGRNAAITLQIASPKLVLAASKPSIGEEVKTAG